MTHLQPSEQPGTSSKPFTSFGSSSKKLSASPPYAMGGQEGSPSKSPSLLRRRHACDACLVVRYSLDPLVPGHERSFCVLNISTRATRHTAARRDATARTPRARHTCARESANTHTVRASANVLRPHITRHAPFARRTPVTRRSIAS